MNVTLYQNKSDNIKTDKVLEYICDVEGFFRDNQSITNPILLIEYKLLAFLFTPVYDNDIEINYDYIEDIEVSSKVDINKINYLFIKEFNRYYYVKDAEVYNNELLILPCHVDVLMSYKTQFRQLNALISRNEYFYNEYIEDDKMSYLYELDVNEYTITTGKDFTFNTNIDNPVTRNYIITTYVAGSRTPTETSIESPETNLPDISYISAGYNSYKIIQAMDKNYVDALAGYLLDNESDASFIISLTAYPFEIPDSSFTITTLRLGKNDINDVKVHDFIHTSLSSYYKVASFYVDTYAGFNRGFLALEPYTKYELHLPYYGYVELKYNDVADSLINIYYSFDWENGIAKINIYNHTKDYVIKSLTATIGIKIAINRTNFQQLADEKTQMYIKSAISTLGNAVSIGMGAVMDNPFMIASGITGMTGTMAGIGSKLATQHDKAHTSNNTGLEGLYGCQDVRLKVSKMIPRHITDYNKYYGKPVNQRYLLADLSGYTEVKDIRIENFTGLNDEKEELISLLTSGIIL